MVHRVVVRALGRISRARHDERGSVLIFVTLMMVTLLGVAALVIDIGNADQQDRQAQVAADSGALAAVQKIEDYGGTFTGSASQWQAIIGEVKAYAQSNFDISPARWQGCTDSHALAFRPDTGAANTCISADLAAWPAALAGETARQNHVRVQLPATSITTAFASVLDQDSLSVDAVATAVVTRATTSVHTREVEHAAGGPCALCVLSPTGTALDGQNGDITVTGGNVVVNSLAATAGSLNPNGHITVTAQNGAAIGGPLAPANFSGNGYSPTPTYLGEVADPLGLIPQCGTGSTCPENHPGGGSTNGATLIPGIYDTISNSHTLSPGIYVITGGITLSGNDVLRTLPPEDGVMLYFACSNYPHPCREKDPNDRAGAGIKATGNGAIRITPPTAASLYPGKDCEFPWVPGLEPDRDCRYVGLSIFADRDNTSTFTYRGNGTNENGLTNGGAGTFYMKSGKLDLRGNGYTLASEIVVGLVTLEGNPSGITIAYDQKRNVPLTHDVEHESTTQATSYDAGGLIG